MLGSRLVPISAVYAMGGKQPQQTSSIQAPFDFSRSLCQDASSINGPLLWATCGLYHTRFQQTFFFPAAVLGHAAGMDAVSMWESHERDVLLDVVREIHGRDAFVHEHYVFLGLPLAHPWFLQDPLDHLRRQVMSGV